MALGSGDWEQLRDILEMARADDLVHVLEMARAELRARGVQGGAGLPPPVGLDRGGGEVGTGGRRRV